MTNKNMRRVSLLITAQTLYNLQKLGRMAGYHDIGRVVDKLVREKMLTLRSGKADERPEESGRG